MISSGYCRQPTIHRDTIVFVSEDDLWTVPAAGGTARRLTSGLGEASTPFLSPEGKSLAFIGRDEGPPEVYVMPAEGGRPERRTFLAATLSQVAGWSRDGRSVLFWSNGAQPMAKVTKLFSVDCDGGVPRELPYGPANFLSQGTKGVVIGRHGIDPAKWKRYRGGRIGQLWIDRDGRGRFERLIETGGNLAWPMWIGKRIYFHSDHEAVGNLYSCAPDGKDLRRETRHGEFYVRGATTDGRRIVYSCGADLYVFDPAARKSQRVEVDLRSPRTQRNRRFSDAAKHLEDYALHPGGQSVAITARGKAFTMANWEGAVVQHGKPDGVRHRFARWLPDGKRLVAVTDEGGEESLIVFAADASTPPKRLGRLPIGRVVDLVVSPTRDQVALSNHRHELVLVDLKKSKSRVLDRSPYDRVNGIAWSPDGKWIAYGFPETLHLCALKLCEADRGTTHTITRPVLMDVVPAFDPEGRFLHFLSYREFDPVYDSMHFELSFPRGMRPCLVTLRKDVRSPFVAQPRGGGKETRKKAKKPAFGIDLDGIAERVVAFPVPEGRYGRILGLSGGALFSSFPVEGSLGQTWGPSEPAAKGMLEYYKFEEQKRETLVQGITDFDLSADGKILFTRSAQRLRAGKAGEKPDEKTENDPPSRKSGWIDLGRIRLSVDPGVEWRQMFDEAWRLMRDHFWKEDMSGVDWKAVRERYRPLVDRVATRSEFSDLVWETQGELGTSHCYEMGGDYRPEPRYDVGLLGAEFAFDRKSGGWKIARIVRGDAWDPKTGSPLAAAGVNVREGDVLTAVNGRHAGERVPPQELLVHHAGQEVALTFADGRTVTVKTLRTETPARYREWVEANRERVHRGSKGRAGYVHIPDMGPAGYSEFHRQYLAEVDREALLVDVRYNGGGHVSRLLLEKLARRRVGCKIARWSKPWPYPDDSPAGPLVALTNESAGSDGDIFSHAFKLYKLGPLVGRRTWGGVVGIWPRHALADGSFTTQPEFASWFEDVGFGVENYGTDPDVDVDIAPHEHAAGKDPQLEKALEILMELLETRLKTGLPVSVVGREERKPK